ncbi:hypothetical protein IMZ48_43260, partial [Candidatus Bathyarchaeota archaeon]|nr:hypothetical protein [Candidatus Bathyarchaeota archaeon]
MPSPTGYSPPKPPDSPADDSDSDLDIDLQELDPANSTSTPGRLQASSSPPPAEKRAPAIALRNLRMSGPRRSGRRGGARYAQLGEDLDGGEHTEALLEDAGESSISDAAGDDAPLLSEDSPGARRSFNQDRKTSIGSRFRMPGFMSFRSKRNDKDDDKDDKDDPSGTRMVAVGSTQLAKYPPNTVSNAKYTAFTFLPVTLYNEFSFFFNMYFLFVALSQAIPALRIGYLSTYVAPLAFVLVITMGKEAYDDIERRRRDNEANAEEYTVLHFAEPGDDRYLHPRSRKRLRSEVLRKRAVSDHDRLSDIQEEEEEIEGGSPPPQPSSHVRDMPRKARDLRVGDVLKLSKGQRVPADVVILKCLTPDNVKNPIAPAEVPEDQDAGALLVDTHPEGQGEASSSGGAPAAPADDPNGENESSGEAFLRTDQLDGETDWKLRLASPLTQNLPVEEFVRLRVTGGKPDKKVTEFLGSVELLGSRQEVLDHHHAQLQGDGNETITTAPLSLDHTAWANTIIASQATTLAVIMYSGPQTRSALSTAPARSKTGLLEYEINSLTKILCVLTLLLSIVLVA